MTMVNRARSILRCHSRRRRRGKNEVNLEADQLGRKGGQPIEPTLRKSIHDGDILAIRPAQLPQPVQEHIDEGRGIATVPRPKKTYLGDLRSPLRLAGACRG